MITVYTKPACVQCNATKKQLDKIGADYQTVDITQQPDALDLVKGLGYHAAPVVIVTDDTGAMLDHWSGYRAERIRSTVAAA